VNFFYKDRENGTLVVFQLTRQISGPKYITQSAFTQFLKSIKFPKDQISKQFKLIFVPGPNQAETMSIVVKVSENKKLKEKEEEKTLDSIDNYTILKIDKHYNLLITQSKSKQSTTDN